MLTISLGRKPFYADNTQSLPEIIETLSDSISIFYYTLAQIYHTKDLLESLKH
jgi:hypothetical protein